MQCTSCIHFSPLLSLWDSCLLPPRQKASFIALFPEAQEQKPQWAEGGAAIPAPQIQSALIGPQIS